MNSIKANNSDDDLIKIHSNNRFGKSELLNIKKLSNSTFELSIKLEHDLDIKFGQYIWIVLPELTKTKFLDRRAFSVFDYDHSKRILKFLIKKTNSLFYKQLLDLPVGSPLNYYGPHGNSFILDNVTEENIYIFAGGSGIAPFLKQLTDDRLTSRKRIILFYSFKDRIPEVLDLLNSLSRNGNIEININKKSIKKIDFNNSDRSRFFISGPQGFVDHWDEQLSKSGVNQVSKVFEHLHPTPKKRYQIVNMTKYIKQISSLNDESHEKKYFGLLDSVRHRYFKKLIIISIFSCVAVLITEKFILRHPLFINYNIVWIVALIYSVAIYILFNLSPKNKILIPMSVNMFGLVLVTYFSLSPINSLPGPWLLLPIVLMFLFFNKTMAVINMLIYTIASLAFLIISGEMSSYANSITVIESSITINLSLVIILIAVLLAISDLDKVSKTIVSSSATTFDVLLGSISNSMNHIIVTDSNGVVLFANKEAEKNTGYCEQEMLGNTPRLWGGLMSNDFYRDLWMRKQHGYVSNIQIANRNKQGNIYYVKARISPILDDSKEVIGYLASEENITDIVKSEENLLNSKNRISNIIEGTELGTWEWNVQTGETIFNNRWAEIIGYELSELQPTTIKTRERFAHPDDLKNSDKELQKHFRGETDFYEFRSRMKHKNGNWIWVLDRGKVMSWTPDGKPKWMYGSHMDITKEKEVDQAKSEFVSLASHQLRTPLSSISWYGEMLQNGDAGKLSSEQKEYVDEIYKANERMVDLINSLLNVSRLELGTFSVEPENLIIKNAAEQVIKETKTITEKRNQKLSISFDENLPNIQFDKRYLEMIIQNLLSNSSKYSPENTAITLKVLPVKAGQKVTNVQVSKDGILIMVADQGYGIPKAQQSRIFSKLYRADNVRDKDTDGTGLGLYIIKSVIEHCGGKIWFKSEENKGTIFFVLLPLTSNKKIGSKKLS